MIEYNYMSQCLTLDTSTEVSVLHLML